MRLAAARALVLARGASRNRIGADEGHMVVGYMPIPFPRQPEMLASKVIARGPAEIRRALPRGGVLRINTAFYGIQDALWERAQTLQGSRKHLDDQPQCKGGGCDGSTSGPRASFLSSSYFPQKYSRDSDLVSGLRTGWQPDRRCHSSSSDAYRERGDERYGVAQFLGSRIRGREKAEPKQADPVSRFSTSAGVSKEGVRRVSLLIYYSHITSSSLSSESDVTRNHAK